MFSEVFPPLFDGWIRLLEGYPRGLAPLEQAVAATRTETQALYCAHSLVFLAEAHLRRGKPRDAEAPLSEALSWTRERGQYYLEPEIYRLSGEIAAALGAAGLLASAWNDLGTLSQRSASHAATKSHPLTEIQ